MIEEGTVVQIAMHMQDQQEEEQRQQQHVLIAQQVAMRRGAGSSGVGDAAVPVPPSPSNGPTANATKHLTVAITRHYGSCSALTLHYDDYLHVFSRMGVVDVC